MKNDRNSNHKTSYKRKLQESKHVIDHVMDIHFFENIRIARHEFGLIGGPIINNSHKDIIDVESKLLGLNSDTIEEYNINHLDKFQLIDYIF